MHRPGPPGRGRKKTDLKSPFRPLRPGPAPTGGRRPSDYDFEAHTWEIVISGELVDKDGQLHEKLLEVPRGSRGTIFFDSSGGSAYVGLALASLIRLRGLKAVGIVAGECSSAALMPLAACAERYVTPHTSLLFHPIRWQSDEQVKLEEAAEWARHFRVMEADHDELMTRLFGGAAESIRRWNNPGRFVTGQEMVDAGLARMIDLFSGDAWSQIARLGRPT
jgi:ATP-dependent Clp protease protease subunit